MTVDPLWPKRLAYRYCSNFPNVCLDYSGRVPDPDYFKIGKIGPDQGGQQFNFDFSHGLARSFTYGNYCGAQNYDNTACPKSPLDCIDAACRSHDACLRQASGFFTWSGKDCHCKLALAAQHCIIVGCMQDNNDAYPPFEAIIRCAEAAAFIHHAMAALCLGTGWEIK